jgi:hypothetical protein
MAKLIRHAGTNQLTKAGMNKLKKVQKVMRPLLACMFFCQTIKVVMSPNGLNAPPAFAATTKLMQASKTNFVLLPPTANTTAPISKAVVRLSAIGDMKKASKPVTQNKAR